MSDRPFTKVIKILREAGLRPTRQRLGLAKLLLDGTNQHITAEELHKAAQDNSISVSLATVYNTLHQFKSAGLLREVIVEPGRAYFDTNLSKHHHFYFEQTGEITDIPDSQINIERLPHIPEGTSINCIDVVVRLSPVIRDD